MESEGGCIRPGLPRDKKPFLACPVNSTRITEQCWVNCPTGTVEEFELCSPICPFGFITTNDGNTCEAEFIKRTAVPRSACFDGERRIENLCLSACPQGTSEDSVDATLCR
jgi:Fe-S-cluster-containing hydrogenase component 2